MVVVIGREPRVLTAIFAALGDAGVRAHGAVTDWEDDTADLFDEVFAQSATHVVGIERLDRLGEPSPERTTDGAFLERCIRACRGPTRPVLVWVTSRGDRDPALDTLQRSGVPYVVLRAAPLVELPDAVAEAAWAGQRILVPNDLPVPPRGVGTEPLIAGAVVDAVSDEAPVGRVIDVSHGGATLWSDVVRAHGGDPAPTGPARAWLAARLGQPVLGVAGAQLLTGEHPSRSAAPSKDRGAQPTTTG